MLGLFGRDFSFDNSGRNWVVKYFVVEVSISIFWVEISFQRFILCKFLFRICSWKTCLKECLVELFWENFLGGNFTSRHLLIEAFLHFCKKKNQSLKAIVFGMDMERLKPLI